MLRVTCATFGSSEPLRPLRQPDADHGALAELDAPTAPGGSRARALPVWRGLGLLLGRERLADGRQQPCPCRASVASSKRVKPGRSSAPSIRPYVASAARTGRAGPARRRAARLRDARAERVGRGGLRRRARACRRPRRCARAGARRGAACPTPKIASLPPSVTYLRSRWPSERVTQRQRAGEQHAFAVGRARVAREVEVEVTGEVVADLAGGRGTRAAARCRPRSPAGSPFVARRTCAASAPCRRSASVFGRPSNGRSSTLSVPSQLIVGTTTSTLERFSAWTRNGTRRVPAAGAQLEQVDARRALRRAERRGSGPVAVPRLTHRRVAHAPHAPAVLARRARRRRTPSARPRSPAARGGWAVSPRTVRPGRPGDRRRARTRPA